MILPSRDLPRLPSNLEALSSKAWLILIENLKSLYSPKTRTQQIQAEAIDSGYNSETDQASDEFEKNHSRQWLTRFLKLSSNWIDEVSLGGEVENECVEWTGTSAEEELERRIDCVDLAASLVSVLSKTSESGAIHRHIILSTATNPIEITLLDALPGEDATAVGLQSWGASIILARKMSLNPAAYGLETASRILELGAGTGLLSLACAKLLNSKGEIVSTDYHASVLNNLRSNVRDNDSENEITVEVLDWSTVREGAKLSAPFSKRFDTIFGGDIIYRPEHSRWLHTTVSELLQYPTSSNHPTFHLIAPLRPTHIEAIASILATFPLEKDLPRLSTFATSSTSENPLLQWRLAIRTIEELPREWGVGRVDELGYREYQIGWC